MRQGVAIGYICMRRPLFMTQLLRLRTLKCLIVWNAPRAVALALNGLVHPAFDVVVELLKARNMDEERLCLELSLNGGVNFGMAEGT